MENAQTLKLRRDRVDSDLSKLEGRADPAAKFARARLLDWGRSLATMPLEYINTMDPRVDAGSTRAIAKVAHNMATYEPGYNNACADLACAKHVLSIGTMVAAIAAESDFSDDEFPGSSEAFDLRWRCWAKANGVDAGPAMPATKQARRTIVRPQDFSDPDCQQAIRDQQKKSYPFNQQSQSTAARRSTVG